MKSGNVDTVCECGHCCVLVQALFEHLQTRPAGAPSASSFSQQAAQKAAAVAASRTGPLGPEFSLASSEQTSPQSTHGSAVPDSPASQSGGGMVSRFFTMVHRCTTSSVPAAPRLLTTKQAVLRRCSAHVYLTSFTSQGRAASGPPATGGRVPGDCYVWGSAAAGPDVALGFPTTSWQHSLSPVLVEDSTHLDVRSVRRSAYASMQEAHRRRAEVGEPNRDA